MQRLAVSLSSDEAVWDAVMNNELVRKLRHSPFLGLFYILLIHLHKYVMLKQILLGDFN